MARTLEARARAHLPAAADVQTLYREVWLNQKQSVCFIRSKDGDTWVWRIASKFPDYKEADARAMLPDPNDPDNIAAYRGIAFPDGTKRIYYRKQAGMKNGYPFYKWLRQNGNTH